MEALVRNSFLIAVLIFTSCVKSNKSAAPKDDSATTNTQTTNNNNNNPTPTPTPPVMNLTDPLFVHSWHLINTGQMTFAQAGGTVGNDINIAAARSQGITGLGVRIAVSDTGVETTHEDLASNLLPNEHRDYTKANAPFQGDPNTTGTGGDHGTSVSGIIGAVGFNGLGSQGIAYGAKLAGFKYVAGTNTLSRMLDQANGSFDVFNYSYGLYSCIFFKYPFGIY